MPDHFTLSPGHLFRRALLPQAIFLACLGSVVALPTFAQTPIHTQAEAAIHYQIPAGSVDKVLNQFAAATGTLLAIDGALTSGKTSQGLNGIYTQRAAMEKILEGTDLDYQISADQTISLVKRKAVGTLSTVKVNAQAQMEGDASGGYRVDTVSQLGPWQGRELKDLPYAMSIVSSELVASIQARDPDQVFRVNPTTQLTRSQYENNQSTAVLRGFRQSVSYRNGMPAGQYGQGTTTEDIERIEILTGLSGFLYGPGNVGGVVNYVTKSPTKERINEVTLGNNGGDNFYLHGDFSGPIDTEGKFSYRFNSVKQDGETAIEGLEVEKEFFSGSLDWQIIDALLLQLDASSLEYSPKGNSYFSFASGVKRPSASSLDASRSYGQPWTENTKENDKLGARLQWQVSDQINFRAAWALSNTYEDSSFVRNTIKANGTYDQVISGVYASGITSRLDDQSDRRAQAFFDINFSTGSVAHKLTVGAQQSNDIQERWNGATAPDIRYLNLDLNESNYISRPQNIAPVDRKEKYVVLDTTRTSLLLGDDITFNEQWSLLVGAAQTRIAFDVYAWGGLYDKTATTPTLSLIYKPQSWLTTYASYIESLEQGGQAALQYNGIPVVNAGKVFDPLLSEQFEIGAKANVGNLLLTAAIFQIDKGLQYYDLSNPASARYVQDGRQIHAGLEFTAIGKITDHWTLIGGFTWLDAEIKKQQQTPTLEGKRPPEISDQFAKIRVEYNLPGLPQLTVIGGIQYYSERFADVQNADEMGAYSLVDTGVRYQTSVMDSPVALRLEIRNLTGEDYWVNTSSLGEPRTAVFSANMSF